MPRGGDVFRSGVNGIPEPEILQAMAVTQGALPPDTVNKTVAGFETSTPAVAGHSGGEARPTVQRLSDTPSIRVLRLASVVRTIVLVLLVFLTHAAVGHGRGLVAFVFTQTVSERLGRGQFV